jgi:hypothetical protein
MRNFIKKTVISLSLVSLIMVGFSSVTFAEPRPFEKGDVSACAVAMHPASGQEADEIRAGLATDTSERVLKCTEFELSDVTEQINDENRMGGR